jgi:hypothetical protein
VRSMWKRKWIIAPIAVAIILAIGAVGAVALAAPGDENPPASAQLTATTAIQSTTAAQSTTDTQQKQALKEQRKAKAQERLARQKERWAQARAKMTPEDQAAFDKLLPTITDQRAAVEKAREDLKGTLKQMKDLVRKYQPKTTPST